jgi:hypothetical protein
VLGGRADPAAGACHSEDGGMVSEVSKYRLQALAVAQSSIMAAG